MKLHFLIFSMSFVVRVIAFLVVPEPHVSYNAQFAYIKGAQMLLEGQGLTDPAFPVYTPPLYSLSIATAAFLFGGDGITGIKIFQIVLDSVTAIVLYLIAKEIFDAPVALLSATIWALYPFAIYSTLYVGTEVFFTFFIALWVWFTMWAIKCDRWDYYCAGGVFLGLATLTRGTTQFMPLILFGLLFTFRKQSFGWLRMYILTVACFTMVILPWGIRNYLVLKEFIPVGANSSVILYGASEPMLTIGDGRAKEVARLYEEAKTRGVVPPPEDRAPAERDRFLAKVAVDHYKARLRNDPLELSAFMVKKFFRLWYSTESGSNHSATLAINLSIYILAGVGIVLSWRRRNWAALILLVLVGYFVVIHWMTLPLFRYLIPVMPYLVAFAAVGLLIGLQHSWPEMHRRFCQRSLG